MFRKDVHAELFGRLDMKPRARIVGREERSIGGWSDTDVKDPTDLPTGVVSEDIAVITQTPVG
jgi:hypothetical protein